jgi:DNA-binding PucR family transcriptional regulator
MNVTLGRLVTAIGEPLVEVVAAPAGLEAALGGVAIVDPDDDLHHYPDQLVLVIGARGRDAAALVRDLGHRGAAAVAVKATAIQRDGADRERAGRDRAGTAGAGDDHAAPDGADELAAAASAAGVAVLAVRPEVRWEHLELLVRDVVEGTGMPGPDGPGDDLFSLAQTIGVLTGGVVSIEDTASRVLAYSRSDHDADVDELRRLSILGWQGPQPYLRMLREWGVFDRLRAGEEVVHVEEHAELGIRRRIAVGIHAGHRQLGTIWVQEGAEPFAERAESVLVGAARVAAGHLIRRRSQQGTGGRGSSELVAGLLDGRTGPDLVAGTAGLDEGGPAVVAAFAVRPPGTDPATRELGRADLADVVPVHAATYRRGALTAQVGARVYAVLPGVSRAEPALVALCAEVATSVRRRTGARVQAGIGSVVPGLAEVATSRAEADRVLDAMATGPSDPDVAVIGELRAEVLLHETLAMLAASPDLRDPAVARLVAYDTEHRTDLVGSVVAWLDALGDVRSAAAALGVHPNTLRYRVRRAAAVGGLHLDEPRARLMHHLQLLAAQRGARAIERTRPSDAVGPDEPSRAPAP